MSPGNRHSGHDRARRSFRELVGAGPVHFLGIGGAGMCALAEAVVRADGQVTGCDLAHGTAVERLEALDVRVERGHDPGHITRDLTAVIRSAAVPSEHPEILRARELGIPVLKRSEALGSWVNAGTLAGVAGTHGKTTTTAMLTSILIAADLDPTGFVGGTVPDWNSHLRPGGDQLFVVEADEYDRSFHHLTPDVAIVTNLEADHLDVYGDLDGVRRAFRTYLDGVREGGAIWICADDSGAAGLLTLCGEKGRSYGLSAGAELRGVGLEVVAGRTRVRVLEKGRDRGWMELGVPGDHNVRNALAAAGAARSLGAEWGAIREGLSAFRGVRRRFQELGREGGVTVVDDYAHHPTEVRAALGAAARVRTGGRIVAVFQPHLYTRTRDFHGEFGRALAAADRVWVTGIYPAREQPIEGVSAELVADAARRAGASVQLHEDLDSLAPAVAADLRSGDLCLTLGAGSIERTGPEILRELSATRSGVAR